MARSDGDFVEYVPATDLNSVSPEDVIVRVFGSEVRALRSAVANGNRVTFLPYGTTLAEARTGGDAQRLQPASKSRTPKPKPEPEIAVGPGNPEPV